MKQQLVVSFRLMAVIFSYLNLLLKKNFIDYSVKICFGNIRSKIK